MKIYDFLFFVKIVLMLESLLLYYNCAIELMKLLHSGVAV